MAAGTTEYLMTAGLLIAFIGLVIGIIAGRKGIARTLKECGFKKEYLIAILLIVFVFLIIEFTVIKPTQLLFFDDAIYQGMAQDLIHMGQAWMCDYGTPSICYSGEVFHEPIGLPLNLAIGFLIGGIRSSTTFAVGLALGAISVFMSFFVSFLLLRNFRAAAFTQLMTALTPVLLVWAMPTNSDFAMMAYSLIAFFFVLIFLKRRNWINFLNMLLSTAVLLYMKVDAVLYLPVLFLFYMILSDGSIKSSIKLNMKRAYHALNDTRLLVVILIFVISITPIVLFSYNELTTGNYGDQGTYIPNTCASNSGTVLATGSISLKNFGANICSNILFWFNMYKGQYIMEPVLFTLIAIGGVGVMLASKRRELLAVGVWFLAFFFLYDAFYAGSVVYGVDWRFMLSLVVEANIFGGLALASAIGMVEAFVKRKKMNVRRIVSYSAGAVVVIILFYPVYALYPLLSVQPSSVPQAGDARFYEGFVQNYSSMIPGKCVVFTYDPGLFNINNRSASQMSNIAYNTTLYQNLAAQGECPVLDWGYWCYTPNNICTTANKTYTLSPIKTEMYGQSGREFGFYYITGIRSQGS